MKPSSGLHHLGPSDLEAVLGAARSGGWTLFELDGSEIVDCKSFFDRAREILPMAPPLLGSHSWDALSDSVWGGLYELDTKKLLVVWRDANQMASRARSDYDIAIEILNDLARDMGSAKDTGGKPKRVCIILA